MPKKSLVHHFPQTIISLLRLHGLWPKENSYLTAFSVLKRLMFYSITIWMFLGSLLYLLIPLIENTRVDVTENIVVFFESIFVSYMFLMYFYKINEIVDFIEELESFDDFGEPEDLETFKRDHNKHMKILYGYCIVGVVIYGLLSHLEEPICERKNIDRNSANVCGLLIPIWGPFDLNNRAVKNIILLYQGFIALITLPPSVIGTYFLVTSIDLVTIRIRHLQGILNSISDLPCTLRKDKLILSIKYHVHIIRLTGGLNKCFGDLSAVHFCLSSIILGILNYQIWKDLQLKGVIHLLGWLFTMYMLCNAGQNLIDESFLISQTLYSLNWHEFDLELTRCIRLMMMKSQQELSLAAGIFYSYSYELLLAILQASYKYMTILTQVRSSLIK